ncbi:carbonic anhydrase family protein [Actinosynnema sp. CS-041913]|uniref:carbonic anhydrase family protein n=1 Tax=Actinosynnema sp. CS-041913 TaxID=3239917 RepID=UPI003D8CE495
MGEQQSPINITTRAAISTDAITLDVGWADHAQEFDFREVADGHRFDPRAENWVRLGAGRFNLENVHFHRPAEHWVDGVRNEVEMHAVHIRADDGLRICVVAVFLTLPEVSLAAEGESPLPKKFNLRGLLPADRRFHLYEGSLTTPGFEENVSWVVMRESVAVTDADLARYIRAHADKARAPQHLNRRFVLASQ